MANNLGLGQKISVYKNSKYKQLDELIDILENDYGLNLKNWVNVERPGFELGPDVSGKSVRLLAGNQEFGVYTNKVVKDGIHLIYSDSKVYQLKSDGGFGGSNITELDFNPEETYALIFPDLYENQNKRVLALVKDNVKFTEFKY